MCELMALSFAHPLSADFSIREFALRGTDNADGWGLAWYPDRSLALVKEPLQWLSSRYTGFLESYPNLRSHLYIAHVRHRTTGTSTHADTHPFARELAGRDYCFAHNGTITWANGALPLGRYHPVGGTDSEHVFCHLLDAVAQVDSHLSEPPSWQWLHRKLTDLNRLGKLNCVLTDGQRLFCFRDVNGWKGLSFRKVLIGEGELRRFEDPTFQLEMAGRSVNHGFVVATRPLSPHGWHSFEPGELLVFQEGTVCFSSHRRTDAAELAPHESAAARAEGAR